MTMMLRRAMMGPAGGGDGNLFHGTLYNGMIGSTGAYTSSTTRITNTPDSNPSDFWLSAGTYTLDSEKLDESARDLRSCTVLTKSAENVILDNFANAWQDTPYTFTLTQGGYCSFTMRYAATGTLSPENYQVIITRA